MVIWDWALRRTLPTLTSNPILFLRAFLRAAVVRVASLICLAMLFCWYSGGLLAHTGDGNAVETAEQNNNSLPIDVGGAFELVDQNGSTVTNRDYLGKYMLIFFGYTQCKNMCSLSLTRIGDALTLLADSVDKLHPLMVTVDPDKDTPEVLGRELQRYHPSLIGLTGSQSQLATIYRAYKQQPTRLDDDWQGDQVVSHQSYLYLMDRSGALITLFPPILNPQSMARIMRKYIDAAG